VNLTAESKFGEGSTFRFEISLPQAEDFPQKLSGSLDENIYGYQGKPRKILVVDDQTHNREVHK